MTKSARYDIIISDIENKGGRYLLVELESQDENTFAIGGQQDKPTAAPEPEPPKGIFIF